MHITEHVIQQYRKRFKCNTTDESEIKKMLQKRLEGSKVIPYPASYRKEDNARYQINGRCVFVIIGNQVVTVLDKAGMTEKKRQKINKRKNG